MPPSTDANEQGTLKYEGILLLVSVLWGSSFVAQRIGMDRGIGPFTFNALRFALGSIALFPIAFLIAPKFQSTDHPATPIKGSVLAGIFLFVASSLQQIGIQHTTVANAGFITSLYIVFTALIGIFMGHKATKSLWFGIAVCIVGLYLLSVTKQFSIAIGDLYVLACALVWAGQILTIDRVAKKGPPLKIAFVQFVTCAGLSAVYAILRERPDIDALVAGSGAVAYAGILSVGVAFTAQVVCQKSCPPGPAAVIMSLEAVFAALAGWLVLGESLSSRALVGCGLIFCGLLVVQLPIILKRKKDRLFLETQAQVSIE